jgi:hypothetical protein
MFALACVEVQNSNENPDASSNSDTDATVGTKQGALKLAQVASPTEADPNATAWVPQTCTPTDDPNCNAVGPYQRLACDPDGKCRFYTASEKCTYSGFGGTSKSCTVETCLADSDCPGGVCIVTSESMSGAGGDPFGECAYFYKTCIAGENTPCAKSGHLLCANNVCTCSAVADKNLKQTEVCDAKDNDCDGAIDNSFQIGEKCDGADSDKCLAGTYSCTSNKLDKECINESPTNVVEVCDGLDNDCDGPTDEDFTDLTKVCDGTDADKCTNGTYVCASDKKGVTCDEVGKNVIETCNGKDDTCDGLTDEGCDDDKDGYCDMAIAVTQGSACVVGDCDDTKAEIKPNAKELCNAVDDNCNGQTDDGIGKGDACSDGVGECKVDGTKICAPDNSGAVVCSAVKKAAGTETCNNKDDSCDGKTDEGCDDDKDGHCDGTMSVDSAAISGDGTPCKDGVKTADCNDNDKSVNSGATEVCDAVDNNCNGQTDEGCDDDNDLSCDSTMTVASGAKCTAGDCNDKDPAINPAAKDVCNQVDDNCDSKVDVKSDGSAACDLQCPLVKKVVANQNVEIDMATLGKANSITSYQCGAASAPLKVVFAGKEVFLTPDAPSGSKFSAQIISGSGAILARLHKSCSPNDGSTAVTPTAKGGTCAAFGAVSVSGGVVGVDYVVLDAKADAKFVIKFTVLP